MASRVTGFKILDPTTVFTRNQTGFRRYSHYLRHALTGAGGAVGGVVLGNLIPEMSLISGGAVFGATGTLAVIGTAAAGGAVLGIIGTAIAVIARRSRRNSARVARRSATLARPRPIRRVDPALVALERRKAERARRIAVIGGAAVAATGVQMAAGGAAAVLGLSGRVLAGGAVGVVAGVVAATIDEVSMSNPENLAAEKEQAHTGFVTTVLRNDLLSLEEEIRPAQQDEYRAITGEGMERFARASLLDLIRSPSSLTESNTPDFLHPMLDVLSQLQAVYKTLPPNEKLNFSLHAEPSATMSATMRELVSDGRDLAGQLFTDFAQTVDWGLISRCAEENFEY